MTEDPAAGTRSGRSMPRPLVLAGIGLGLLIGAIAVLAVMLLVVGRATGTLRSFRIPSEAMEPTFDVGDRVLTARLGFPLRGNVRRGDVLVFHPPQGAAQNSCRLPYQPDDGHPCAQAVGPASSIHYIKRVVGLPGDRIKIVAGRTYVNGALQPEPFIRRDASCPVCNLPKEITVPPGQYYMLGDNRGASADSRLWGPIRKAWIEGREIATYWPL